MTIGKRGRPPVGAAHREQLPVRLSVQEKSLLTKAAATENAPLSTWIRTTCLKAARLILSRHNLVLIGALLFGCGGEAGLDELSLKVNRPVWTNDANCGAAGYACVGGRHCIASHCMPEWLPMTTTNAPTPRSTPAAAISNQFIVAGGTVNCRGSLATGASYNPTEDKWTTLPNLRNARSQHSVVSSGTAVYAFGGLANCASGAAPLSTLETWSPGSKTWTLIKSTNAPIGRYAHESTWTGNDMFIFGGSDGKTPHLASGTLFNPTKNTWTSIPCSLAGCGRNGASVILDGGYVRMWGGSATSGLEFSIIKHAWTSWPVGHFPTYQHNPTDDGQRVYLPSGGCAANLDIMIFDKTSRKTIVDTTTSPKGLSPNGSIAWVGAEVILWSGNCGAAESSVGARYQPPAP